MRVSVVTDSVGMQADSASESVSWHGSPRTGMSAISAESASDHASRDLRVFVSNRESAATTVVRISADTP
jgi:hypothetical protein